MRVCFGGASGTELAQSCGSASALAAWAKAEGIAWLSFWSASRDQQCAGGTKGYPDATCSSVVQSAGGLRLAMGAY